MGGEAVEEGKAPRCTGLDWLNVVGRVSMSPMETDPEPPRLLAQVRQIVRMRHYSPRTEEAYLGWIRRYVRFHGMRHPSALDANDVRNFVSSLATRAKVSASTQNQAVAALCFLYRDVLGVPLDEIAEVIRAKRPRRLPVVLSRTEVERVLAELYDVPFLVTVLLYGSGLRLMEAVTLRVKDLDFAQQAVLVRGGKGGKDRITMMLPGSRAPSEPT